MGSDDEERMAALREAVQPVEPDDLLAEAGRKILLVNFIEMLDHEAGSRSGADIEAVHDMRVATRRMRSLLRLLQASYKKKTIRPFTDQIRIIAGRLGAVRDLDVMIDDLTTYQKTLDAEAQANLQTAIDKLVKRRDKARQQLIKLLDSKPYQQFIKRFSKFLTTAGKGANPPEADEVTPYQVRHVVPVILHQHLAAVRAYDTVMENGSTDTLHALRIEFKRLRYAVSFFSEVLGTSTKDFIDEIKAIQDHLGRLNDVQTGRAGLNSLIEGNSALQDYLAGLEAEAQAKVEQFPAVWARFNSRTIQRHLSDALLVLR